MKKIFKYFGLFLSLVLMGVFASCNVDEISKSADVGLGIKVFAPTKVVAGQPMTINGSGFSDAKEIVFPNGVSVTDFEIVSNDMIRVDAPSGISADGGKIIVRTSNDQIESKVKLTIGNTVVSGYSKQEGETAAGGELITIYGTDLEFINAIELLDSDGLPNIITHEDFYRKGSTSVIFYVPRTNIFDGNFVGKVYTYDGKTFLMPDLKYEPYKGGGHWEIKRTILWKNETGDPIPGWGGKFRFSNVEASSGEEIYAFSMEDWAIIKDGTFRAEVGVTDASNIRITTGWWSAAYGGPDHNCIDMVQEDETGTKYIELNLKEDGNLYELVDAQHLLFTGDAYTLLSIYTEELIWVEEEEGHWETRILWKNDGTHGDISWNGTYRFANEQSATGEEIYAFTMDEWAMIKEETVRVSFYLGESPNIRITTGWWTGAYGGADHNCIDMLQEEEDGTPFIELNIKGDGNLYDNIDQQHLLFTGDQYKVKEIYVKVWVKGSSPKPEIFWENEGGAAVSWNGTYRFALEGHDGNNECIAQFPQNVWDRIKTETFYMDVTATDPQVRVTTGWWDPNWNVGDIQPGNELLTDNGDGTFTVTINLAGDSNFVAAIDERHILFTGDRFTPVKLYFKK